MAIAKELAILITGQNTASPTLQRLQQDLRGVQGAATGTGVAGAAAGAQMGKGMTQANRGVTALKTGLVGAASAISPVTLGIAGLGVAGVLAAKGIAETGMSWESAFAGVRKTVDATDVELAGFAAGIRDMAKAIPASREEIARVAEAAGQLGIKNESLLAFTRTMVDMGVATNMSAEEAATSLARLANITGMPQSNFDRLGSTVVDLGNKFATTEAEIVEFGLRIAGAGSQIGLTEPQILAWGAALSSVGINAEAGGTAISRTFVEMAAAVSSGGEQLALFAQVAGMTVPQFAQLFKSDANAAVLGFVQGLGQMKAEGGDLFATLENLGMSEIRQRDAMLRLAGASDLLAAATTTANTAWQQNNALTTEAERRYATTASQLEITMNKWSDLVVNGFEASQPALNATVTAISNLATFLGDVADRAGIAGEKIGKLPGAQFMGKVGEVVGGAAGGVGAAIEGLQELPGVKAAKARGATETSAYNMFVSGAPQIEVPRGTVGQMAAGQVNAPVSVSIDAGGNASVSADTDMGRKVGDAIGGALEALFGTGGTLERQQGGANPYLAGAG